ncbi:hypothetical protein DPMN_072784 [Dreissena polymorpha]|uniref:Uncharacterized protein n=1 Tax=Dreissena polymorpha TaxID=45954 RepID=A0A9D4H9X8_DREPO|nr:hypothetical protein DPMN_072784 [Dreissena polymorpha]
MVKNHDQQHCIHHHEWREARRSDKYMGVTVFKVGTSTAEVLIRIAAAMVRLSRLWISSSITFPLCTGSTSPS